MMVHRDRLVQQVRVAARWERMKEWLEERTGCWNPGEEYRRYLSLFGRPSVESGPPTTPMSAGSSNVCRETWKFIRNSKIHRGVGSPFENSEVRIELGSSSGTRKFIGESEVRLRIGCSYRTRMFIGNSGVHPELGSSLRTRKFVENSEVRIELGRSFGIWKFIANSKVR
ncbi:hypothetical protein Bca4012_083829 [Brassica carinata]